MQKYVTQLLEMLQEAHGFLEFWHVLHMETIVSEKRTKAEILKENPKMTAINYLYDK